MESVGFPFNNLYFVIHSFNFAVVNSIIAVIEDTISILVKRFYKGGDGLLVQG